ncbi:Allergen Fus c 3 [Daldinia childiae]|uniref:Allergen Fus c 3 n=1 Tax=Daldinia childiae TaxID=326645 RepID=UPI0014461800|nr:Allergen Fus c 3 [Daldinia childiae]KAF3065124.1 Allergen Fus c 3 [Daldinia childiae]
MLGYQNQSLPPASVPSIPHYVVGGHNPTDVNMGSSTGASFTTPTGDPFGLPFYQAVPPESRSIDAADTYRHNYPPGHKKNKHSSRSRKSKQPQVLSPGSTSSTSNSSRSRLRSASRTSKNTHHNPPATVEEQKSRDTHNQVEKQYRNRLNAHFESLLDALPETMQAGEGDDEGESLDLTDRRVSKAEVLDMARRHIQALERECAALEGERDELRNNMERLRWLFGRCEGTDGFNEQLNFPGAGGLH